jgi:coiled-coil domain-containing protein 6
MQTDSECESDVSSIADSSTTNQTQLVINREHLIKRIDSLTQENRVLKVELETYKLRLKASQQEIKQLKHASVHMQAKAEQEEEFISNTLLKKIQELKKEKETLANNYEREEEFLTNDLSRKLQQLREEKQSLEHSLEQEQASQINKLMKRINRLEAETINKQNTLVTNLLSLLFFIFLFF